MRIATFTHISDLHIGRQNLEESLDAAVIRPWAALPWFDGLLGHSYDSLAKLDKLFRRLLKDEDAKLIFTGDLTSMGHPDEFVLGESFLDGDLTPPYGNFIGLQCPDWRTRSVSGNHDHWPGSPVFGLPGDALYKAFRFCPFMSPLIDLPTGHKLRFAGIDTDGDVNPMGLCRLLARGAFLGQLAELDKKMPPPEPSEIRALVLHHSICWQGLALSIGGASRSALSDFARKKGISVLLCGHTHVPKVELVSLSTGKENVALNACCGSSSRITTLPFDLTLVGQRVDRPTWIPNSVLVHRLIAEKGGLQWQVSILFETSHGFEENAKYPMRANAGLYFPKGRGLPDEAQSH